MVWSMAPALAVYLALLGLMFGSFINLAADRLPRRESLLSPRSHCRSCGRQLNAIDLLPVAGYLARKGKCATCGVRIGPSSPVVEAVTGACMAVPVLIAGPWPGVAIGACLVAAWGSAVTGLAVWRHAETAPQT